MKKALMINTYVLLLAACIAIIYFPAQVHAAQKGTVVITGSSVNIRSGPDTGTTVLATYPQGTELPALGEGDGWYRVKLPDGSEGWIIDDYSRLVPEQQQPEQQPPARDKDITINMNGLAVSLEVPPYIDQNNRTMVPIRFVAEELGAAVGWDGDKKQVSIALSGSRVFLWIGSGQAEVDGSSVEMDTQPVITQGRTFVPLRFIGEAFGAQVGWDGAARVVSILQTPPVPDDPPGASGTLRNSALVIGSVVNVRSGPGLNYAQISQVKLGDSFPVLARDEEWYRLNIDGDKSGWVHGSLLSIQSQRASRGDADYQDVLERLQPSGEEFDFLTLENVVFDGVNGANIFIQANNPIDASAFELDSPWRLVIDVPGTRITGLPEAQRSIEVSGSVVGRIRVGQFEADTARVVVDLNQAVSYRIDSFADGTVLGVFLETSSLVGKKIVLDPGHGGLAGWGADPGAIGPAGTREADVVLAIAKQTAALLTQRGAVVTMTRTGETNMDLNDRAALANNLGADLFVSIHANASYNSANKGSSVYFYASGDLYGQKSERVELARAILDSILQRTGTVDLGIIERPFLVIKNTNMPSVLVETAFISNPGEEMLLADADFQSKMAAGIAAGIERYFQ